MTPRTTKPQTGPLGHWQVFAEAGAAGNNACVYRSEQPVPAAQRQRLAAAQPDTTHCFAWPEDTSGHCYRVHCHNGQTEIQRCGHGLLAVASSLLESEGSLPATLLTTDDIPLALTIDNEAAPERAEVHLPRLHSRSAGLPAWAEHAFDPLPQTAATAGDDNGYWVFEWGGECDLAQLRVDSDVISRHTTRAVIATRAAGVDHGGYDFHLRYFAPQYGVVEDAVTGSANAVLADYWAERLGSGPFRARQCSPGGGVVYSRLAATGVAISGEVVRL